MTASCVAIEKESGKTYWQREGSDRIMRCVEQVNSHHITDTGHNVTANTWCNLSREGRSGGWAEASCHWGTWGTCGPDSTATVVNSLQNRVNSITVCI